VFMLEPTLYAVTAPVLGWVGDKKVGNNNSVFTFHCIYIMCLMLKSYIKIYDVSCICVQICLTLCKKGYIDLHLCLNLTPVYCASLCMSYIIQVSKMLYCCLTGSYQVHDTVWSRAGGDMFRVTRTLVTVTVHTIVCI
jgi:hypothetical protein